MSDASAVQIIVLAFIERDDRVLLSRRPAGVHLAGLWEFPGGKVILGEPFTAALQREVREELGVTVTIGEELAVTRHAYPDRIVELHLFRCCITQGEPIAHQSAEIRWVALEALDDYEMPPANAALLAQVPRAK